MKHLFIGIVVCVLSFAAVPSTHTYAYYVQGEEAPAYAKWGRLAVLQTKSRYPQADIIDYLHIGRERKNPIITVEKFKLWLRENGREFGVFINIEFETRTEKLVSITFIETER
ncbi:DUF3889 domain-containing protein [Bacillus sp. 165]|uniref:DUF3889 domain-containing protein n=1 Tax=Bacillus sp. 165 TaxID=1529117 RepID=UPI001ADBB7B3|nr:DUF3889 domain-containing protein [Bacillus sp. 165]MBO9129231.1 YqzG/YhdC family protein [Bacillus sp. 165]